MDSSQVFLAKSIPQTLIKDNDLENSFHGGNTFLRFVRGTLSAGLANYVVCLSVCPQVLRRIQRYEEKTTRYGMVMQIYNPLSQQEQEEMDRRFAEPVDALEFVSENNNHIERIILV